MGSRLLLLANDSTYGEHLQIRLDAAGCHVRTSHSPNDLKDLLLHPWDAIVSDSHFGGQEPEKLLNQLNPDKNPVFFYTENFAQESADLWKKAGAKEVFSKLRRGELVKAVSTWLSQNSPKPTSKESVPSLSRAKKFLLVDDSPTIRKFVKKIIEHGFPGSEIYEAEDGKTAMHELAGQKMDLIITDMQMPGVDGLSFIKTLHGNALLSKKPIIILSGMVTREMQAELGTVPTVRILSKPAEPGIIVQTIHSLLKPAAVSN